jgi:hypothetical protein
MMTEQTTWNKFDRALELFKSFLEAAVNKGGQMNGYHVIFNMGTVARFNLDKHEFTGYTGEYVMDWPIHRLPKDDSVKLEEIIENNNAIWLGQKSMLDGDLGKAVRCAYNILVADGYPYPCGDGFERTAFPCADIDKSNILWSVVWTNRDPRLTNLAIADTNIANAITIGGELRRLDYMFPHARVIIAPDLTITRLDEIKN